MSAPNDRHLYAPGHTPQPFEPGVFDDALDAYPPYQRYEGPVSPEAMAAAQEKAAELGLAAPASTTPWRVRARREGSLAPATTRRRRRKNKDEA